ncbi:Hybrid signal transduction histidine kinase A [Cytospora mali]|uniref:Hybrid signal transduction histidine kinase A n=1 Tax=Cytospora mali TaxID=578113 RepID=A0A194V112_CYTMA|nr:Hybrid signal transduction histidine kinase A [Valsa mali var. pyri (nom. inval.)]
MHPQLGNVAIVDLLEADPRPTFIVDLTGAPRNFGESSVAYYNPALSSCPDLVELVESARGEHAALWEWITASFLPPSPTKARSSSASGSPSSPFYYLNAQWSKCLVHARWLVVGTNEQPSSADRPRKVRLDSERGSFGVSGSANKVACSTPPITIPHHDRPSEPFPAPGAPGEIEPLTPPPQRLSVEPDLVLPKIIYNQEPYQNVLTSVDWASTPLGPLTSWPALLKQTLNQVLADSRPIAIYWGDQYITIYNEAFSKLCGSKHPGLLGKSIMDLWPGAGAKFKESMRTTAVKRHATIEEEWRFFMERTDEGSEETYLKWSVVPIIENDEAVGYLHPVLDVTSLRLWERRMKMLIDLGDALVTARDMKSYWAKTMEFLESVEPQYDIPLAILYSVEDDPQAPTVTHSLYDFPKICRLEGALGVPKDHPIAPPTISLRNTDVGLASIFRDALHSQYPLLLQKSDGSLPESLVQGLEWRGFGDACRNAVICPIRPTRDENVMGMLLLGLNPRRPYDNDYRQYISLLNQKLTSTLASTVLLEEEARRGRNAAQEAAYEQARLKEKLADTTREATESVHKFEAVADFIPVGMAFQNAQGVLTFANDAWHRITGNPLRETGPSRSLRDILSYIVEEDKPSVIRAYERLHTEDSITYECRLTRRNTVNSPPPPTRESPSFEKSGVELRGIDNQASERHILAAARAERAPDGSILQVLTCLTDVTLHKQTAEEAIRRAQQAENLKRMAELATVGMYEIDLDGQLVEANKVFFQMCGLEKDDTDLRKSNLKPWQTSVVEEDLPALQDVMNKVIREGTSQTIEVRFKSPWTAVDSQGTEIVAPRWAYGTFLPVKSSDGTIQSFCGCVSDVSLQKWQLEQERLRKEEALESKRQQENFIDMTSHEMRNPLSAIIHCADAVIASLSKALEVQQSNKKSLSRQSSATAPGGLIGGNDRPEAEHLMESSVENAETIIACAQHQKRIVDDILTMSKLDSKLLAVTPITVDPLQIVQEALKMFEVEARRVDIDLQMRVDKSYEELGLEYLDLDPSRLKQVLINLLTNALKFTKGGPTRNVTITVSASTQRPSDSTCSVQFIPRLQGAGYQQPPNSWRSDPIFLMFEVKDTGQGLTEDEMKSLFQRFKQASARTHVKYGGSGLGLFISRRLCEMHNGAIGVASLPGVGSTFAFYVETHPPSEVSLQEARATARTALQVNHLPMTTRAESLQIGTAEVPLTSTPNKPTDSTATPDRHTEPVAEPPKIEGILVVEDNLINQQITRRGLADRGFTVDVANHGLEALEKLRASDRWIGDGQITTTLSNNTTATIPPSSNQMTAPTTPTKTTDHKPSTTTVVTDLTPTATPTKFPLSLILMDVEMPIQDGLTCTRQIRELERQGRIMGGHIPIIAVSANARLEQVLEAKAAGCDDVMVKPYRMPELIEKMMVVATQVDQKNRGATESAKSVSGEDPASTTASAGAGAAVAGPGPPAEA